jgi:hypothetical protein
MTAASGHKVLVAGPPGSGKTIFAAGFPYPMLVLAFEPKFDSAAEYYRDDKQRLDGIDVRPLWKVLDDADPIEEFLKILREELIPQQRAGQMKYKTLVVDSMTTFSAAVLNHIVKTNPGVKRSVSKQGVQPCQIDYGILKREFQRIIPGLVSLPMNVVMISHIKTDRSELTGEIIRQPYLDGSFGEKLPEIFSESYLCFVKEGKHYARTKSNDEYKFLASRVRGMPEVIPLSYEELIKKRN